QPFQCQFISSLGFNHEQQFVTFCRRYEIPSIFLLDWRDQVLEKRRSNDVTPFWYTAKPTCYEQDPTPQKQFELEFRLVRPGFHRPLELRGSYDIDANAGEHRI